MSISLPNGALVAIAAGYSAATIPFTSLSNAATAAAVVTNTFSTGDFVEVTSGWSRLTSKVVRLSTASATGFALEGVDTTLTSIYPALGGVGTARKISSWTQLSQILTSSSSGGAGAGEKIIVLGFLAVFVLLSMHRYTGIGLSYIVHMPFCVTV